jgi:Lantibiotic dehydratase, C terminus./Lantibiotic dehydratase, N terminus.
VSAQLFPFVFGRICGLSFDVIAAYAPVVLRQSMAWLQEFEEDLAREKAGLCEQLFIFIKEAPPLAQKQLQNIRRSIFNGRRLKPQELEYARSVLQGDVLTALNSFLERTALLQAQQAAFHDLYNSTVVSLRLMLQEQGAADNFQQALTFSSDYFVNDFIKYQQTAPAAFRNEEFDIEKTLLRYLSRMCTKTSPFGRFTSIFIGQTDAYADKHDRFQPVNGGSGLMAFVRLNSALFHHLKLLLRGEYEVLRHFKVYLNRSLCTDGEYFSFIISNEGRYKLHRIVADDNLRCVQEILKTQEVIMDELRKALMQRSGQSAEVCTGILSSLVNVGFIEPDFGISVSDPQWNIKLEELLAGLPLNDAVVAAPVVELLRCFTGIAKQLESGSAAERSALLQLAGERLAGLRSKLILSLPQTDLCEALCRDNGLLSFKPRQLFFEDSIQCSATPVLPEEALLSFVTAINHLTGCLYFYDRNLSVRLRMLDFYRQHYNEDQEVPLWLFFEQFSLTEGAGVSNSFGTEKERIAKCITVINRKAVYKEGDQELHLSASDIMGAAMETGLPVTLPPGSMSAFVQLYEEPDGISGVKALKAVVNSIHLGFGKMFSRFLYYVTPEITQLLRELNANAPEGNDALLCENNDNAHSNANIHPQLLPCKLRMPGGSNNAGSYYIDIADILVREDRKQQRLMLVHRESQKEIVLYDLGLQLSNNRSPLFDFLSKFTSGNDPATFPIVASLLKPYLGGEGVLAIPRIVYDGKLILQRKAWCIPCDKLLFKQPDIGHDDYFLAVNKWRKELGLPARVFVHLTNKFEDASRARNASNAGKGDSKPQYIDFHNPLLVLLYAKIIRKAGSSLLIEEMLPGNEHLYKVNGEGYVTEHLVQWYNR